MEEKNVETKKLPQRPIPQKPNSNIVKPLPPKPSLETEVLEEVDNNVMKQSLLKEDDENKQEKNKKVKEIKNKEPKQHKVQSKRKKITIMILIIVFVAVCAAVGTFIILNINKNKKLNTPTIKVEQLYNGTVLEASKIEGAKSYEFEITNLDTNKKENLPLLSNNIVELKSYLNKVGKYSVRVRAIGKTNKATSEYSEIINFENYKQLDAPKIDVKNLVKKGESSTQYVTDENILEDIITWNAIDNAKHYIVRYGVNLDDETIKTVICSNSEGMVNFSLSEIYKNGTGNYQISVVAVPEENSYYLESDYQKIINIEYYSKQDKVINAVYDKTTKNLQFTLDASGIYASEFEIYLTYDNDTKEHIIYFDKCEITVNDNIITAITNLYQIDNGNVLSIDIKALGDGKYSTDSEVTHVVIK